MLVGPVLLGALFAFSACGTAATSSTSSVLNLESTNYHTLPPTLTTLPPSSSLPGGSTVPGETTPAGGVTTGITEYKIQAKDYPSKVAKLYNIPLAALDQANTDTTGYGQFYVGLIIKIPAGATVPTTTAPPVTTLPDLTGATVKGGSTSCVRGTYTIQSGDLPAKVAKKFDITRAQLDAANVNTKGYTNFIVGSKIIIPAKAGCTG
jgi:LysM repeat protein